MRRHGWFYSAGMEQYVIRGGQAGYDRLKVLARARWPGTAALLDRVGVQPGQRCLDLGCGGGDVTLELARMVGPDGQVTGVDMDEVKLDLARRDAAARGLGNVSFQALNVYEWSEPDSYDLVYSRNVLQHLSRPVDVLASMWAAVRPGGVIVVEDADFEGSFCNPPNDGFAFWVEAYQRVLERRGGDPLSGRKLFRRFGEAGIPPPEIAVVQSVVVTGEEKTLPHSTIAATADAIVEEGIASEGEVSAALAELEQFAEDITSICGSPRIFQAWTRRQGQPVANT